MPLRLPYFSDQSDLAHQLESWECYLTPGFAAVLEEQSDGKTVRQQPLVS